ncbi:MAG: site-specific integrase [Alphaproteobacteria bacterium]|jgi:integrase|nr:site-specific integrase [Alphaproteobacteria bacterium]
MRAVGRHLYVRNGYFYYRCRFPKSYHSLLPKEFVVALNTQDLSEGRMLSIKLEYELNRHLKAFQTSLSELKPEHSPESIIDLLIAQLAELKSLHGSTFALNSKKLKVHRPLFSDIVSKYLEDCTNTHGTRFHKENTYLLFKQIMGDLVFKEIGIVEARKFKSCLSKIPANAKKRLNLTSFENLDFDKLKGKAQHAKTINNRLAYLIALFTWAIRAGYYHGQNPFSNLIIKGQKVSASRRHPFKEEELKALFLSPVFTGCKGKKASERLEAGEEIVKDALYWVPLIGLYSGMRLGEICQLYVADIRQEDGIYIFDVNDEGDDKALKTASSRRKIPIHNQLIKRGFLEYLAQMKKQKQVRLFPEIAMGAFAKTYSSTFTKRFWRLLLALQIKRQGLCFHSLRHTFIDGMRNAGVERSIVMTMTGHQSSKGVHDDYGYGYNLTILQEGINKLTFSYLED